jgi:nucleotide-binding universal stress UspA family protein
MFNHLLVPLDGSALAELALPLVQEITARFGSKVTLLRVVRPPFVLTNMGGGNYAELFDALRQEERQEVAAYMQRQQATLADEGYTVNSRVVEGDSVADVILDVADELQVDSIVMSTHGRSGVRRWVFGSVADKVLRQAKVPLLLVRAQPSADEEREEWSVTIPAIENLEAIRSHEDG